MNDTPRIVSDVMTQTVVAVSRTTPFKEIVRTLEQWHVSALPVLEGEARVIGVVSEADLLAKEEFKDHDPSRLEQLRRLDDLVKAGAGTAGELMTTPAVTIHSRATLAEASRVMVRRNIKRLPVVDEVGKLTGIVSRSDLLKVYLREDEDIAGEVRREIVGHFFRDQRPTVEVAVDEGVVTLTGTIPDTSLIPVAARLVRSVAGVVNVEIRLTGHTKHSEPPTVGPQF
ncbi:CBS domain-containing protein [Streptomyces sp. H39-S7]|uniref:CBS domain-containing protein n=1 Tax=Streptomyces sp. H39-S7 TaxID=3004357 RepID=UPI0022AEA2EB|nr:CBS domain-containing protein [Streptomyces sp. H39-S7]MCZ4122757.1 CBS domain-containing protein [Streptomyces sp. H39-S7]